MTKRIHFQSRLGLGIRSNGKASRKSRVLVIIGLVILTLTSISTSPRTVYAPTVQTFSSPNAEAGGKFGATVAVGQTPTTSDFNGDFKRDFVVAAIGETVNGLAGAGRVYVIDGSTGLPLAALVSPNPATAGNFGSSLAIADINADGKADLVVGSPGENSGGGRVYVFPGNGFGGFGAPTSISGTGQYGSSLGVGDMNSDGKLDLVVGRPAAGYVNVSLGNGDGSFQASHKFGTGSGEFGYSFGIDDFNLDGALDVVVGAPVGDQAYTLLGNGDGSLQSPATFGFPGTGTEQFGSSIAAADVNLDSKLDVFVGGPGAGTVYIFQGIGSGSFTFVNSLFDGGDDFGFAIAAAAVNPNYGYPDALVSAPVQAVNGLTGAGAVGLYQNVAGSFTFTGPPSTSSLNPETNGNFGHSVALADLNSDSLRDKVVGAPSETVNGKSGAGRVYIFFTSSITTTTTASSFSASSSASVDSSTGAGTLTFATDKGLFSSLNAISIASALKTPPLGLVFPYGLFSFTIGSLAAGDKLNVAIALPSPVPVYESVQYWKLHGGVWARVPATNVTLSVDRQTLTLKLKDGAVPDDDDSAANGLLADVGGLAYMPSISLVAGWNSISLPVIPYSTSPTVILAALLKKCDLVSVWGYVASSKSWQSLAVTACIPGVSFTVSSTLSVMTDGNGYWINMKAPDALVVNGTVVSPTGTPPAYSLVAGWNLVGFKPQPTVQPETVGDYLTSIAGKYDSSSMWIYDSQTESWVAGVNDSTILVPGQAIWLLVSVPATLRPPH